MTKHTHVAGFVAGTTTTGYATVREGQRVWVTVLPPVPTPSRRSRPHARGGGSYTHFHAPARRPNT